MSTLSFFNALLCRASALRLSIAWRLGLSFVAVAALASAANFFVAGGESFVRETKVVVVPERRSDPAPAPTATVTTQRTRSPESIRNLEIALDRYEGAVLGRSQANTADTVAQLAAADDSLRRATDFFADELETTSSKTQLRKALKEQRRSAQRFVASADMHGASLAAYAEQFEAMNTQMKDSVDRAWKIFGRVVARQSLIELSNELDTIRRTYAALAAASLADPAARDALIASEQAFAQTLRDNEASLARSQGRDWVQAMQSHLTRIVAAREDIEKSRNAWKDDKSAFTAATERVRADTKRMAATRQSPAAPVARTAAPVVPAVAPATALPATSVEVLAAPNASARRSVFAALTGMTLAILLAISASTVVSIVRPIRRMIAATEQLAHGRIEPLAGGGIKELDTLARAFNSMAGEMATARDRMIEHHTELETRVEQRTRQLKVLAEQDPLTHLPNRRQFAMLLEAALAEASRAQSIVGLFFLDVDNFKHINDSLGHEFGDRVIVAVAERLKALTGAIGVAARLGGDEFTVIATRVTNADEVRSIGQRLIAAFQEPLWIDHREIVTSLSIGASIYPDHERTPASLLRAADVALFHAKALGRTQLAMFSPNLLQAAEARFATEQGLRRAIDREEFELVFQPELSAESLEVTLVEALVRWRMSDGRLASPGEFLAIAEQSGLIVEIGDWVLRTAVATAARWHHGAWPNARVAVNVSPRQLLDSGFADRLTGLLEQYSLPSNCIELELTESVLQTGRQVTETLQRLRSLGIAIALDDFGTGYSSLASLEQLPLTRIKLDRSLIDRIDSNARSAAIAQAIVSMCHGLGLEVTAEGIERPEQFHMLLQHRAMYLQGYLLSRPVSEQQLLATLTASAQRARLLSDSRVGEVLTPSTAAVKLAGNA